MATIENVRNAFKEWLYIEDEMYIDCLVAFWIAHKLPGDPVWMIIIGPSGDLKTEALQAFRTDDVFFSAEITEKTLITGRAIKQKFRKDYDLAPKLNGKIWVIYDFSLLLKTKSDYRDKIFAQMRDLYDGMVSKSVGTGQTIVYGTGTKDDPKIKCSVIAACTPEIDRYLVEQQMLGTRHVLYRVDTQNIKEAMRKIRLFQGQEEEQRERVRLVVREYLKEKTGKIMEISPETEEKIQNEAEVTAKMRAGINIDWQTGEVTGMAKAEKPTRIYKMFRKIFIAAMNIEGYTEEMAMELIKKIARSSSPETRVKIKQILDEAMDRMTAWQVAKKLRIGERSVMGELNALVYLGFVEKENEYDEMRRREIAYFRCL